MAYIPNSRHLELYVQLFDRGMTHKQIAEQFESLAHVKEKDFEKATPYFFMYTRGKIKQGLAASNLQLTEAIEEQFVKLITNGIPLDKAAKIMNVPLTTVTEEWFPDYPLFEARVRYAIELANTMVVAALHRRATGYRTQLRTTSRQYKCEGIDRVLIGEVESDREEEVAASTEAAKLWLTNRASEQWSTDGKMFKDGNKSKILDAIEDMTAPSIEDIPELKE